MNRLGTGETSGRSITCPSCGSSEMVRLRTQPSRTVPTFAYRLFECRSCSGRFLSGESWLGRFSKRHIPVFGVEAPGQEISDEPADDKGEEAIAVVRVAALTLKAV